MFNLGCKLQQGGLGAHCCTDSAVSLVGVAKKPVASIVLKGRMQNSEVHEFVAYATVTSTNDVRLFEMAMYHLNIAPAGS